MSYLYIGHADGTISLCNLSKGQIVPMTTVPLGRSPISLCTYAIESAEVVVAVGDQTALLKPRDERLDLTPILTKVSLFSLDLIIVPLLTHCDPGLHICYKHEASYWG